MNPRFTLVLVLIVLLGGAGALWYLSAAPAPSPSGPSPTPIAATASTEAGKPPAAGTKPAQPANAPQPSRPAAFFILAISWEPAFCETVTRKPECESMTDSRFDADHFALHGLWPADEYCAVSDAHVAADRSGYWDELPAPKLSAETRAALDEVMPGTQSMLERHEWVKHGTCARVDADSYYARAIALLSEINASSVRELFAGNIGQSVTQGDIRTAFDDAFGNRAGSRVRVACERDGSRLIVTELTVGLYGDVMGDTPLASLIGAARPTSGGCDSGVVDRVGRQ